MIITCPACGARYDAPDDAIPEAGRMVRCSACRAEWLAPADRAAPAPPTPEPPTPEPPTPEPPGPEAPSPEPPADAAAPAPFPPAGVGRAPTAPGPARAATGPTTPAAAAAPAPAALSATLEDDEPDTAPRRRGGFMAGFALSTVAGLAAIGVYARHEAIAAVAPQLAAPLARYVAAVDRARDLLTQAATALAAGL